MKTFLISWSPVLLVVIICFLDIFFLLDTLLFPLYLIPVVLIFLFRSRPWTLAFVSVLSIAAMYISDNRIYAHLGAPGMFFHMVLAYSVFCLSLVLMDSDRKKHSESRIKWKTLFELLPVGVSVLGPDGKVLEQNATLAEILRMTPEGIARGAYKNRIYLRSDGSPLPPEEFASSRVMAGEKVVKNVITGIVRENGETLWSAVSAAACDFKDWKTIIVTADITALKTAEDRLEQLVKQKELILREVHHRIKNNMATLSGMLVIQADSSENPEVRSALTAAVTRIQSMMVLYSKLFITRDFCAVNLKDYLPALTDQILSNFPRETQPRRDLSVEDVVVGGESLMALSIILNELITNSMKYAFKEAPGTIRIRTGIEEGRVYFEYSDLGQFQVGQHEGEAGGFGLQLIRLMIDQIGGIAEPSDRDFAGFRMSFPDKETFCRD